jgi:hypothetical protein
MLTHIEKLDQQFPGLAAQVRAWFAEGVPVLRVVELLQAQYGVSVPKSTIGNFRVRRWAREQEARLQALVKNRAARELTRELEMRDSPEAPTGALQAKVRAIIYGDISRCFARAFLKAARAHRWSRFDVEAALRRQVAR